MDCIYIYIYIYLFTKDRKKQFIYSKYNKHKKHLKITTRLWF